MLSSTNSSTFSRVSSSGSSVFRNISEGRPSRSISTPQRHFSARRENNVVVIPKTEYERIKSAAVVLTKEEWRRRHEQDIRKLLGTPVQPTKTLQENKVISQDSSTSRDSEVDRREAELRQKLEKYRMEQEDEIKKTNEIILEVQCLATREQQVLDKQKRISKAKSDDQQLEKKLLREYEELDKKWQEAEEERKQAQKRYAETIKRQIENHNAAKMTVQQNIKDWEATELERKIQEYKQQTAKEKEQKEEMQRKLKEGLESCVMEKNRLKELNKKREMIQLEHLAKQRQNQETFAAIVQEDKQLKEKLWQSRGAYVYDVWNQCQDNRHELRTAKIHREKERLDRLWRQQELDRAVKSAKMKQMLREERDKQIREKAKLQQQLGLKMKKEHEEIVRADYCEVERQKTFDEKKRQERQKYISDIRLQIQEKERYSRQLQEEFLKSLNEQRIQTKEHEKSLKDLKTQKLQELRSLTIPEKYLRAVARKSKIPWDDIVSSN